MKNNNKKDVTFKNKLVILGCGFIGQGVLPLIFKHIDIKPEQVFIITSNDRGCEIAKSYHVSFSVKTLTYENHKEILDSFLEAGDFLLNLTSDADTIWLIDYCSQKEVLYLDTAINSSCVKASDATAPVVDRSIAFVRNEILNKPLKTNGPTAVIAHGANPGIVSHLVKQALINIAQDEGRKITIPKTRDEWAKLSQSLGIKTIHIAERDTQVVEQIKLPDEFVNTWSIDGFICEGISPAELGWGTHEKHFPKDGLHYSFANQSAIYLNTPGASVRMRTWLPLAGAQIGFLIPHQEALSLSSYFTVSSENKAEYRPTVHYVYHPCDDAMLSLIELHERNWQAQKQARPMQGHEIISGIDELGVLLMGHKKGAYWFGSRLSIDEAKDLAPHNSATSLQVVAGVISGVIWAIRHPHQGVVEAEQMDFEEVLEIAAPYWGKLIGEYSQWTPLNGRNNLFPEEIDATDPWQFKNFRV
ncbi:MAG: saccharopine dehydrogenase C-terminal domain-containing protein [Gammaproteobacteria bacterium]|jgi:homospermidine synthase